MKTYLTELIERMSDDSLAQGETLPEGVRHDSSKSISFRAMREAEKLHDAALVPVLKEMILAEKDKKKRDHAYFILMAVCAHTKDAEPIGFLLEQLKTEKDKYVIMFALDRIKNTECDLSPYAPALLAFATDKRWQVQYSALHCLGLCAQGTPGVELCLLDLVNNSKNEFTIEYSCNALMHTGTILSVDALKKLIREQKNANLLSAAIYALGKIDGKNQVAFFMEQLELKKDSFVKAGFIKHIVQHAGEEAIEPVAKRVKTLLGKKKNSLMVYVRSEPELVHALRFLMAFTSNETAAKTLEWAKGKTAMMDETELKWADAHLLK